jgi:hypothetical protein
VQATINLAIDNTTTESLTESFTEAELDVGLLDSIRAHAVERGTTPASYIVPLAKVFGQETNDGELCAVIVIPEKSAQDVDYAHEELTAEVRTYRNGERVACLRLAGGNVALSAQTVSALSPEKYGRIVTLWLFQDRSALWKYPVTEALYENLWVASLVADNHAHQDDAPGIDDGVTEVFDNYMIAEQPAH